MKTRLLSLILCIALLVGIPAISAFAEYAFASTDNNADAYTVVKEEDGFRLYVNGKLINETGMYFNGTDYFYVEPSGLLAYNEDIYTYYSDILPKAYYRFGTDCKLMQNGWADMGNIGKFYFKDKIPVKGLNKIDDDYYFFNLNNANLRTNADFTIGENEYGLAAGAYHFGKDGKMEYKLDTPKDSPIRPECTEHKWGKWVLTTKPTYTEKGEETRPCLRCGLTEARATDIVTCDHVWRNWYITEEPTEEKEGTQERFCFVCHTYETDSVPVLDCIHSYGDWTVLKAPTYEEEGIRVRYCRKCGEDQNAYIPVLQDAVPAATATATNVKVSNAFSDNMMLQRDKKLSVWGTADASSGTVVVTFGAETAVANVGADSLWKAEFSKTFRADGEGQRLCVYGADSKAAFSDVLVGDVYYVIGQSNVFYTMENLTLELEAKGLSSEINWDYDDSRDIRFFRCHAGDTATMSGIFAQGTELEYLTLTTDREWMTASEVQYNNTDPTSFSALGYLMAYNMSNKTDIPIGIIEIDAAGMPLISFAPNQLASKWGDEIMNPATGVYTYNLRNGLCANELMISRFVYNHFIHPIRHFSTAGIVWYQGESDALNSIDKWGENNNTYAYQFAELMKYFRSSFGNSDFPVYMIEFPTSFSNSGANAHIDFGSLRGDQGVIGKLISDFHLVSSADFFSDITWYNSLHPYIKHKQAMRLADIVLANGYSIGDINYVKGPQFDHITYSGNSATVTYTNVGDGLKKNSGSYVYGYDVWLGELDIYGLMVWVPATSVSITGKDQITINAASPIKGVRYHANTEAGYPGFGEAFPHLSLNLANSNNVPASAFVDIK